MVAALPKFKEDLNRWSRQRYVSARHSPMLNKNIFPPVALAIFVLLPSVPFLTLSSVSILLSTVTIAEFIHLNKKLYHKLLKCIIVSCHFYEDTFS